MLYTTPNKDISSVMSDDTAGPDELDTPKQGSDRVLLIAVIFLMIFGSLAVFSAIAYFAEANHTSAGSLMVGHIVKLSIAFLAMLITSKVNYHTVAKFSRFSLLLSWVLLIVVMFSGTEVFGAKRYLSIGAFSFQPSSLAAVSLLTYLSALLAEKQDYIKDFKRSFVPILFWVLTTFVLIGIEDFGSASILLGICLLIMFVGRISMLQLGGLIIIGALGASLLIWKSPERQSRLDQYLEQVVEINSSNFNVNQGYQTQQAYIAIAQGELFGVGIGKSTQRDFLPAPYNDFIFAIIAEEYGLVGSIILLLLFVIILYRGIAKIAKKAPDTHGNLLAVGCTLFIVLYGFVNAGVASGLLPVTGLPMPFVSYGGTSTLFAGLMIGILLNISKHTAGRNTLFYA